MFSRIFTAAGLAAAASSAAIAADLSARAITKAVPYVQGYNWTGFYAGVNVGYAWARPTVDDFGMAGNMNGVIGGAQIGYNWQAIWWSVSIPTSKAPVRVRHKPRSSVFRSRFPNAYATSAPCGGRLGYTQDRWFAYVTGGYAHTNFGIDGTGLGVTVSSKSTNSGCTLGSGLEYAFAQNRWASSNTCI